MTAVIGTLVFGPLTTTSATFVLTGGTYRWKGVDSSAGTWQVQELMPDGSTWNEVVGMPVGAGPNATNFTVGYGTYKIALTAGSPTAAYHEIDQIP